jgi:hypothetical protein
VRGLLIADIHPVSLSASPLVTTAEPPVATAAPVRRGVRASVIPGLGAALAIVLLLGLGAGRELRDRRWSALRVGL